MKKDVYKVPNKISEGLYKEKGSKFISYLYPVTSLEQIESALEEIKKSHPKARHVCYAYRLAPDQDQYRMNDDGEPSGTAGKPIYGQIKSAKLHEILIAVVRYFGGTKLGASGLIRAYKTAAEDAINQNETKSTFLATKFLLEFDYAIMGDLMNALKTIDLNIEEQIFDESPRIVLKLHRSKSNKNILQLKAQLLNRALADVDEETSITGLKISKIVE